MNEPDYDILSHLTEEDVEDLDMLYRSLIGSEPIQVPPPLHLDPSRVQQSETEGEADKILNSFILLIKQFVRDRICTLTPSQTGYALSFISNPSEISRILTISPFKGITRWRTIREKYVSPLEKRGIIISASRKNQSLSSKEYFIPRNALSPDQEADLSSLQMGTAPIESTTPSSRISQLERSKYEELDPKVKPIMESIEALIGTMLGREVNMSELKYRGKPLIYYARSSPLREIRVQVPSEFDPFFERLAQNVPELAEHLPKLRREGVTTYQALKAMSSDDLFRIGIPYGIIFDIQEYL